MADPTRRSVIAGACAILALGVVNLPQVASASVKQLSNGRLSVRVRSIPELAEVGGAVQIGNYKGRPVGLARTGASTYVAFSLRCPHRGVTVERFEKGWVCREHGSEFESDGDLILGPATRALTKIPTRLNRGNVIVG